MGSKVWMSEGVMRYNGEISNPKKDATNEAGTHARRCAITGNSRSVCA